MVDDEKAIDEADIPEKRKRLGDTLKAGLVF